ncbi:succinylglutamate desuccinylase/aspartoacylase family protein [Paraburkholderia sp. BCC1884]|uniref:succinylglutamate desuccinylase/aspartoacylase family protein n=1 Tax=Paraburkholderia sp. BCC1884 TaxID=2562668 RepID=UPI001182BD2E|nr:succinylglutamate desuccinylase/aspartoacylase family protein [Paraburkholderia sp. BCC1884]
MSNPISSEINFDENGKHTGYLRLPHSVHRSAYGWIPIPVASIRNGDGPAVLISAGNHGDEYEGQIIVASLIREIEADMVRGQLILLPMANYPAAQAGLRTSPLDDGNLNRCFPGNPSGTPTQIIADYIENILLARADYLVDIHSGGSSLLYDGGNMLALSPRSPDEEVKVKGMLAAFGLPKAFLHAPNPVNISAAARRQGAISILTELGGAGMSERSLIDQGRQGLLNFLGYLGVLQGDLVPAGPPATTRFLRVEGKHHYVYTRDDGLYEPLAALGQRVAQGQPAARIHFPETPWREPIALYFEGNGEVACKRVQASVRRGDCIYQLADDDREHQR